MPPGLGFTLLNYPAHPVVVAEIDEAVGEEWNQYKTKKKGFIVPLDNPYGDQSWLEEWVNDILNPLTDVKDVVDGLCENFLTPATGRANDGLNRRGRTRWLDPEDAAILGGSP